MGGPGFNAYSCTLLGNQGPTVTLHLDNTVQASLHHKAPPPFLPLPRKSRQSSQVRHHRPKLMLIALLGDSKTSFFSYQQPLLACNRPSNNASLANTLLFMPTVDIQVLLAYKMTLVCRFICDFHKPKSFTTDTKKHIPHSRVLFEYQEWLLKPISLCTELNTCPLNTFCLSTLHVVTYLI